MPRATWFCVDIECSGPVPTRYDLLSVGCAPVTGERGDYRIGEPLYVELKPVSGRADPGAMAINGLDLAALSRDGLPVDGALDALDRFVAEHTQPGSTPVFVGHNAPFDWSFVNQAYHDAGRRNPFGYKALDTKALAMGVLAVHWLDSSKELLAESLPLPEVEQGKVHRADYDAWFQAHILVGLLQRMHAAGAGV